MDCPWQAWTLGPGDALPVVRSPSLEQAAVYPRGKQHKGKAPHRPPSAPRLLPGPSGLAPPASSSCPHSHSRCRVWGGVQGHCGQHRGRPGRREGQAGLEGGGRQLTPGQTAAAQPTWHRGPEPPRSQCVQWGHEPAACICSHMPPALAPLPTWVRCPLRCTPGLPS